MLWLLLFHISAVLCWSGSLLYLPALIAGAASSHTAIEQERQQAVVFLVYRLFSTPAALLAIATGTALFMTGGITELWLVLKLTLVVALVLCHALTGLLLLMTQLATGRRKAVYCLSLQAVVALLIPMILWTVLTKPF